MPQQNLNNNTALEVETLFANDEVNRPLVTPIIKATFDILADGQLNITEQQLPVNLEGEHWSDPETSSYLFEPECAFTKPATDIVIIGEALSNRGPVSNLLVDIRVGLLAKRLAVFGDRYWQSTMTGYQISPPETFESIPLTYENAFGGWDKRHSEPEQHGFEPRNTVGKGYYLSKIKSDEPMPLPNIEDPDNLIQTIKDRPTPAGCGFTLPHWKPRANFAGTYDDQWQNNRSPLLPLDFNRRYFNAASEGLIASGYLLGSEAVHITNMTSAGELNFYLPGVKPPICQIELKDRKTILTTNLDTVIINTHTMQLQLIWRNYLSLNTGPHDVESIDIKYG